MAKEAGEKTADYEATNGQQQLDEAKAEAQVRLSLSFLFVSGIYLSRRIFGPNTVDASVLSAAEKGRND